MNSFWNQVVWGNTIQKWALALTIIVIACLIYYVLKKTVLHKLKVKADRTNTIVDDMLIAAIGNVVMPLILILILYWSVISLNIPDKFLTKTKILFWITAMFFILRSITTALRFYLIKKIEDRSENKSRVKQANGFILLINVTIWIVGFIFLLDNLGFNIGTLLAGLGIGGIAIALAAQTILGDLFAYFIIYFDKPFEIGDFISFDDKSGTVEEIGLKSTHIRVAAGEQLITSNKYLTDTRVHNYGRMQSRLIIFRIKVVRQTPIDLLKLIPQITEKAISAVPNVSYVRSHLVDLGSSAFEFEIVYRVESADFSMYRDRHQDILYGLTEALQKNRIQLAYPTESRFVEKYIEAERAG